MKKFFLFFALAIMTVAFGSCSKDDDNNPTTPSTSASAVETVVGDYTGNLSVVINELAPIESSKTISVEKAGDNTVNLTLKDFSIVDPSSQNEIKLGDVKLSNVEVKGDKEPYTFTASEVLKLDVFGTGTPMDIPVEAKTGEFKNNQLSTTLTISVLNGMMTVNVEFNGTKN